MINFRNSTIICRTEDCKFHIHGDEGYCILKFIIIGEDARCHSYEFRAEK